ncbi:MAG: HlyD family efflux transporter periplasmic adaptor subunit [Cyanobacteria bacterium P01_G01_bin.54]
MSTAAAQKKYRAGVRWLLGAGAIALVSVGGALVYFTSIRGNAGTVAVPIMTVERGDVTKTVSAGGVVQVGNQQTLKAPTTANESAIVERIEVSINSRINAGDILVRLRNPAGLAEIETQRFALKKQRLALAERQTAVQRAEVDLAKAQRAYQTQLADDASIQTAEIALRRAENELAQQQAEIPSLEKEVATTAQLVDQGYLAQTKLREEEERLRNARAQLENLAQAVQEAAVRLNSAQLSHRQQTADQRAAVQNQELAVTAARQQVAGAQQDLAEASQNLRSAEAQFAKTSLIRATTEGRVLAIHTKPGAVLAQGDRLLTIGNPRREEVELQLTTLQAALVETSQPAEVTAIGVVSGTFPARVQRLDRVASTQGDSDFFGGGDTGRVQAVVVLTRPSGSLIPGGQVSIEIEVAAAEDVLKLPPQFIQGSEDETFVWVVDAAGQVEQRSVEVGLVGDTETEIQAGLTVGEQVASPPPEAGLEPEMKVEPLDGENSEF